MPPAGVEELPPDAIVIRGGQVRDPLALASKVELDVQRSGPPAAVSVWALTPRSGEDRATTIARIVTSAGIPHSKVQVSTVRRLIDAGFALELDTSDGQAECHYNVSFTLPVDTDEAKRFIECFDEPEEKPTGGGSQ